MDASVEVCVDAGVFEGNGVSVGGSKWAAAAACARVSAKAAASRAGSSRWQWQSLRPERAEWLWAARPGDCRRLPTARRGRSRRCARRYECPSPRLSKSGSASPLVRLRRIRKVGRGEKATSPPTPLHCVARGEKQSDKNLLIRWRVLATNRFASDDTDFSSTPAISDGQLFVRSNKALYCVSETK